MIKASKWVFMFTSEVLFLANTVEDIVFQSLKVRRAEASHWVPTDSGVPMSTWDDTGLFKSQ